MLCIIQESDDPFFNLAIEEVLLKNSEEEYLILGINKTAVIIGKHQSAHRETSTKFIFENNIPVIRRISGGGTVFHDKGNLNFTFICNSDFGKQVDFRKYTRPVIEYLFSLGIDAKFEGKNDIKIDGLKVSGNAEHVHRKRVLHHGTLLFSSSLDMMRKSIRNDTSCYISKAVESNPSSVVNLNERLKSSSDIFEFRSKMMNYFFQNLPGAVFHTLSYSKKKEAELLATNKYKTWEWNYAYGPEYTFNNSFVVNNEYHTCSLSIKNGIIVECTITGSYEMKKSAKKIIGCRHMVTDLQQILREENILVTGEAVYNFF
jgi:lipoate---protein ligase